MWVENLFEEMEGFNLFILKFCRLVQIAGDVSRFGAPKFICASSFKDFNYTNKNFIKVTSMLRRGRLKEAVKVMDSSVGFDE